MLSHPGLVYSFQSNIELYGKSMGFPWKSSTNSMENMIVRTNNWITGSSLRMGTDSM